MVIYVAVLCDITFLYQSFRVPKEGEIDELRNDRLRGDTDVIKRLLAGYSI